MCVIFYFVRLIFAFPHIPPTRFLFRIKVYGFVSFFDWLALLFSSLARTNNLSQWHLSDKRLHKQSSPAEAVALKGALEALHTLGWRWVGRLVACGLWPVAGGTTIAAAIISYSVDKNAVTTLGNMCRLRFGSVITIFCYFVFINNRILLVSAVWAAASLILVQSM